MEVWQWVVVSIAAAAFVYFIVVGAILLKRSRGRGQGPAVLRTPEQERLRQVRRIRDHFGRGGGGGLGIHIPYPEIDPRDTRLEDWETTARQMAQAEQLAEINAQVGEELARAARDISRSQQRTEAAFLREVERVREAFQTLGLEPPQIRTRQGLVVAEVQLEQAAARLARLGV